MRENKRTVRMQGSHLLAVVLSALTISAQAADPTYFRFSELLESGSAKDLLDPSVKLYWGAQPTPDFAEVARPDTYTRSSISISPFGGSKRHCVEAFEKALNAMIGDARARGYDAVIDIRAVRDGKPSDDPAGFNCKPGYKTTEVPMMGSFAMTSAAMRRAAEAEERAARPPARPPVAGAIFVPLDAILSSPEATAILGPSIDAYWGIKTPAYSQRHGPDEYSEEADIGKLRNEDACKQAVLKTLSSMVQEARTRDFNSIIKIRSFLNGQFAPVATDVECQLGKKTASVTLQASLASKK
jgi:uncharacterized protein YbjQ (UPF0145 family)